MKKQDLKTGMRVKLRNGDIYLVIKDIENEPYGHQEIAFINNYGYMPHIKYTDNLKMIEDGDYDIVEVFTIIDNQSSLLEGRILNLDIRHSIWKRTEKKEMTIEEIEKELGYEVKIVQSR